ncbi:MAG: dihydrodipicolinate synthase family protein [Verrucomicrobiota bacterium]
MAVIEGIFVPNIVPYDAQGRIAEDELRHIIRWLVSKGVTGFYPNGSMGEFIRLSYEERKRVLKIVVEEAAGKPILAGAAEPNVDLVLEMCRYCADLGCRAVSITGPYYFKLSAGQHRKILPGNRGQVADRHHRLQHPGVRK